MGELPSLFPGFQDMATSESETTVTCGCWGAVGGMQEPRRDSKHLELAVVFAAADV